MSINKIRLIDEPVFRTHEANQSNNVQEDLDDYYQDSAFEEPDAHPDPHQSQPFDYSELGRGLREMTAELQSEVANMISLLQTNQQENAQQDEEESESESQSESQSQSQSEYEEESQTENQEEESEAESEGDSELEPEGGSEDYSDDEHFRRQQLTRPAMIADPRIREEQRQLEPQTQPVQQRHREEQKHQEQQRNREERKEYEDPVIENDVTREQLSNIIISIPSFEFRPKNRSQKADCAVCLCRFEFDDLVKALSCGHLFHARCINSWMEQKLICPCCKTKISID